jgi:hypothetical protein
MGSIQSGEYNWGTAWKQYNSSGSGLESRELDVGIPCAHHATPRYPSKLTLTSPKGGGLSVGIVLSQTMATEVLSALNGQIKQLSL